MSAHQSEQVSILLVDDQPEGLVALDAILGPLDQRLVRARSGREALRALLKEDFALILLDVVMPELDGFETARLIRERSRSQNTPIIFLTALSRGEMPAFQAYALGAVDYILKPIEPDILRSKVAVFVELARKTVLVQRQAEALREAERRDHERELAEAARRIEEERAGAREALLRQEVDISLQEKQWLEGVLNAMPTPLVMLEPGLDRPLFVNRAARTFPWSESPGSAATTEFSDHEGRALSSADLPAARAAAGERLDGVSVRWRNETGQGSFLAYSETLPSVWGHDATVLMTMLDVTKLTQVEERLNAAIQTRDAFLSVASHELKTPLTTLGLQVQRLCRAQKRGEPIIATGGPRDPVVMLDRATGRLNKLVNDLLDVSRIAAGKLEMQFDDVDLVSVVHDVIVQMKDDFAMAHCSLKIDAEGSIVGRWDRSRLEQVIANLATNAMKYAAGKPVEIAVRRDGDVAFFIVRDEGIGISPQDQSRIFKRFERAASEREYGGLGLGLWIVQEIVGNMGGQILVESALGQGSTFTVKLPCVAASLTAEGDDAPRLSATA
jgi:signal transduction histidine kinase/FixJ family two-component response regulator